MEEKLKVLAAIILGVPITESTKDIIMKDPYLKALAFTNPLCMLSLIGGLKKNGKLKETDRE